MEATISFLKALGLSLLCCENELETTYCNVLTTDICSCFVSTCIPNQNMLQHHVCLLFNRITASGGGVEWGQQLMFYLRSLTKRCGTAQSDRANWPVPSCDRSSRRVCIDRCLAEERFNRSKGRSCLSRPKCRNIKSKHVQCTLYVYALSSANHRLTGSVCPEDGGQLKCVVGYAYGVTITRYKVTIIAVRQILHTRTFLKIHDSITDF